MKEEKVRTILSVTLLGLNADIIKVVIPQVELFAGSGVLDSSFMKDYKAFPLYSQKKAQLIIYNGVEKKEFHYDTVLTPSCQQTASQSNLTEQALQGIPI